jgi:probable F420-dependent oxidoreductase
MELGKIGVFSFALEQLGADAATAAVARLESCGYGAVWVPEARGKEAFSHAALLLRGGERIAVCTGIASIWGRDPMTAAAAIATVGEAYPGRFVVGLGVSHRPAVEQLRGQTYRAPVRTMERYLDRLAAATYEAARPEVPPPLVLAALGPRMLELAARRTDGVHTYFVPVEHTPRARAAVGSGGLVLVEHAVVDERDPQRARAIARTYTSRYLRLDNYRNNLLRLGWAEDDLRDGGSDRLVDAVVAWGDRDAIRASVHAHLGAGADHVCVQVLREDRADPALDTLAALAPVLLDR